MLGHVDSHKASYSVRCDTCWCLYKNKGAFERHVKLSKHGRCSLKRVTELGVRPDSAEVASTSADGDSRAQSALSKGNEITAQTYKL